ncbi:hypothetical protein [Mesorhizobium sp. M0684]|uniref:hypothetical protein n=1 Tax=Mesorhizobium sp. M0684 TaxID=2956986 RepID=UPI00333A6EE8
MKTFTVTTLVAFAPLTFAISAHAGEVLDRVLASKTLNVATIVASPPGLVHE